MSTSLSRLKKSQPNAPTTNGVAPSSASSATVTDDDKIRQQLLLDMRECVRWIKEELSASECDTTPLDEVVEGLQETLNRDK